MSRFLSPFGSTTGSFARDGIVHLGGAPGVVANPGVTNNPHPIQQYFDMLGVPDAIKDSPLDTLPRDGHTINTLFDGMEPTMIRKFVIRATLESPLFQHFAVCPPVDAKDNFEGIGTHVLRFNTAPLSRTPEGASGTFVRHRFEKTAVKMERWGQALELYDDFTLLPDGQKIYEAYLDNLNSNMTFSGMMAVMTALLHAYDNKRSYMQNYGGNYGLSTFQNMGEINRMFGGLHKTSKYFYQLGDYAAQVSGKQATAGRFTHAFLTAKALRQVAFGDDFNSEYSRHGPGNMKVLEEGTDGITRMPDGTIIVKEPDQAVDGTDLEPGKTLQMLRTSVSTGRFNAMLLDPALVSTHHGPVNAKTDMTMGFLNMDRGDGQIETQTMKDLVSALVCWGQDGELNRRVYEYLTTGKNAENLAQALGVSNLTVDAEGVPLLDPFISTHPGGVRLPTRIVGNMHTAYLDADSQNIIADSAAAVVRNEMTKEELKAMQIAIKFAEDNKNASPESATAIALAIATVSAGVDRGGPAADPLQAAGARRDRNIHGVFDLPSLVELRNAYTAVTGAANAVPYPLSERVVLPGFSSIKHLRTVRDFVSERPRNWYADNRFTAAAQSHLDAVADGVDALIKFAGICRRIWSPMSAVNTFFRREALPWWIRSNDRGEDEIDAFLQNIVLGIGYPTGLRLGALAADPARDPSAFTFIAQAAPPGNADVANGRVTAFLDAIRGQEQLPANVADQRVLLEEAKNDGAFGANIDRFWIPASRLGPLGAPVVDPPATVLTDLFADLVITDPRGGADKVGFAGLLEVINDRMPRNKFPAGAAGNQPYFSARIKALSDILSKLDTDRGDAAAGVPVRMSIQALNTLALTAQLTMTRAYTMQGEPENSAEAERRAALAGPRRGGLPAAVRDSGLSFSANAWARVYVNKGPAELAAMPLLATNPANPGYEWLGQSFMDNADQDVRTYYSKAAREKYQIDETCMGKIAGAAFSPQSSESVERPAKRPYMPSSDNHDGFGASMIAAGARYAYVPPARDPYDGAPRYVQDAAMRDADGSDDPRAAVMSSYSRAPHRVSAAVLQEANTHFKWRWRQSVEAYPNDIVNLSQHLLLLGMRVHRSSFVNLVENGVPPPVGVITVDPFLRFDMTHAVFAVAGCGNLYYAFPQLSMSYDANHKVLHAFLTVWMKAHVHLPENVFVAENVAFESYEGGGDGSLIRTIYSDEATYEEEPVNGYDYDPGNPTERNGNRFALHVGVSTRLADIPNPLPLTGSFSGQGAYHGIGRFVNTRENAPRRRGLMYDSALVANRVCGFSALNRNSSPITSADSFVLRTEAIGDSFNTVCYIADQWKRDHSNGSYKLRAIIGDGPLGRTTEGVMAEMNGGIGLIENKVRFNP